MSLVSGRFLSPEEAAGLDDHQEGSIVDLEETIGVRHAQANPSVGSARAAFAINKVGQPMGEFDPVRAATSDEMPESISPVDKKRPTLCGSPVYDKVITAVGEMVDLETPDKIFMIGAARLFQTRFMGRQQKEIVASLFAAEQFFADHYGLDFSPYPFGGVDPATGRPDPATAGVKMTREAVMFGYMLNPDIDLRVYTTSDSGTGTIQPRGAQKIFSGGWAVRLVKELPLRGRFAANKGESQITYPAGTLILFGDYLIRSFAEKIVKEETPNLANPDGPPNETIKRVLVRTADDQFVKFQSRTPITSTGNDILFPLDHVVEHAELGTGIASGTIRAVKEGPARWRVEATETWKFPGELLA